MHDQRRGVLFGIAAYALWGVFPLYFTLLEPAGPPEILAHRIIWSLLAVLLLLLAVGRIHSVGELTGRQRLLLAVAAVALSINWLTYVYAVSTDQVVEASLGYFINPLVTVALGVLVLHERLSRAQWVALGIAATAVALLTLDYGRVPWIALTLACSFGLYGLLRKQAGAGSLEGLTFETAVLLVPALAYLTWLGWAGDQTFTDSGSGHTVLFLGLGVVTAAPLLLFGAAATRIPLTTLGLLQYIAPVLQFLIGVVILHEPMPPARWAGFALVWVALIVLTVDSLRRAAHNPRREPVPASPEWVPGDHSR